jgi:hypothetical protein
MSDYIKQGWLFWKLIIFKTCNGYFLTVAAVYLAATDGVDLAAFSKSQKVRLFIFCAVAGGKFLEGFFDQTLSRLQKGKPLIPTEDETTFTHRPVAPVTIEPPKTP